MLSTAATVWNRQRSTVLTAHRICGVRHRRTCAQKTARYLVARPAPPDQGHRPVGTAAQYGPATL